MASSTYTTAQERRDGVRELGDGWIFKGYSGREGGREFKLEPVPQSSKSGGIL